MELKVGRLGGSEQESEVVLMRFPRSDVEAALIEKSPDSKGGSDVMSS